VQRHGGGIGRDRGLERCRRFRLIAAVHRQDAGEVLAERDALRVGGFDDRLRCAELDDVRRGVGGVDRRGSNRPGGPGAPRMATEGAKRDMS
jgi:hypothetical protein